MKILFCSKFDDEGEGRGEVLFAAVSWLASGADDDEVDDDEVFDVPFSLHCRGAMNVGKLYVK